jgi:hypothetical protein
MADIRWIFINGLRGSRRLVEIGSIANLERYGHIKAVILPDANLTA